MMMEKEWKKFYLLGAVFVFLSMGVMLLEIFLTAVPDGAPIQQTSLHLLELYNRNWFMGMRYMGLMNIIAATFMIPVFYCLYGAHKNSNHVLAGFALLIAITGYAVFLADNVALPILELSQRFAVAIESERAMLITATEALFAKGASHTPGTFLGFLLVHIGNLLFNLVILRGKVMKRRTGIVGFFAFTFLLIFEILSSFVTALGQEAMIFAMIGGISALVWYVMVGIELLSLRKQ